MYFMVRSLSGVRAVPRPPRGTGFQDPCSRDSESKVVVARLFVTNASPTRVLKTLATNGRELIIKHALKSQSAFTIQSNGRCANRQTILNFSGFSRGSGLTEGNSNPPSPMSASQ
jgi:hypothetical protein